MKKTLGVINELKEKGLIKDYAIGGAIGVLRWVEPFFTRDLDIFIAYSAEVKEKRLIILTPIYEYLKEKGCYWDKQWIVINGLPVDFIVAEELERKAIEEAQETEYEGIKTKVLTPEYLIALCLRAGRDKDDRKIDMLLTQAKIDMEKLNEILNRHNLKEKFIEFKERYYGR